MALSCPNCGSPETSTGLQNFQCLTCGKLFDRAGNTVEGGLSESTRTALQARLAPRATVVVGNIADLQRIGADAAVGDSVNVAQNVSTPQVNSGQEIITPAQDDARKGLVTRETERTGDAEKIQAADAKASEKRAKTRTR